MARLKDQRGSVAIIAVALLGVSLLLMAMIVDLGTVWLIRARVQTAADAATLAGVSNAKAVAVTEWVPDGPVTKIFGLDDTLPPAEDIINVEPVYEAQQGEGSWEDVLAGHSITYMQAGTEVTSFFPLGSSFPADIISVEPVYEAEFVEGPWEDVLVGYEVTYIETWTQIVTGMSAVLEEARASQAALEVFEVNVQRERQSGVTMSAAVGTESNSKYVSCTMTVQVETPSEVLAPLMGLVNGQGSLRSFKFSVSSESKAVLDWK